MVVRFVHVIGKKKDCFVMAHSMMNNVLVFDRIVYVTKQRETLQEWTSQ